MREPTSDSLAPRFTLEDRAIGLARTAIESVINALPAVTEEARDAVMEARARGAIRALLAAQQEFNAGA